MSIEKEYQKSLKELGDLEKEYYKGIQMKEQAINEMGELIKAVELDESIIKIMKSKDLVFLNEIAKVKENLAIKENGVREYEKLHADVAGSVKKRRKEVVEGRKQLQALEQEMEGRGRIYEFPKAK
jgi:hypothetical protein